MPSFNPVEESSLLSLITALRGGIEPSTAYSLLTDVLNQQGQRVDERQARMSSLTDLISGNAMQGMSYEGAQALAGAYTRGDNVPPRIEDVLGSLYPQTASMYAGNTPSEVGATRAGEMNQPVPSTFSPAASAPAIAQFSGQQPAPTYEEILQTQLLEQQVAAGQQELETGAQEQQVLQQAVPEMARVVVEGLLAQGTAPENIIGLVASSETFQGLDAQGQAIFLQAVVEMLQASAAQAAGPAAPDAQRYPATGPSPGYVGAGAGVGRGMVPQPQGSIPSEVYHDPRWPGHG